MGYWPVFQSTFPSLLHWWLPFWSCIPFVLSSLKCPSPAIAHIGLIFIFQKSAQMSPVWRLLYLPLGEQGTLSVCPNLPWWLPRVCAGALWKCIALRPAGYVRLRNRLHWRELGNEEEEKGPVLLPDAWFLSVSPWRQWTALCFRFYFVVTSCTSPKLQLCEILSRVLSLVPKSLNV